jgi:hypothetical protein
MNALRKFVCGTLFGVLTLAPCYARPQGQGQHGQHHEHAAQWLKEHKNAPAAQAQRDLESDPNFRRLSPQRQDQLRQRLQHFSNSPAERRDQMIRRLQTYERLTPEQQQRAQALFQRFRALPPERRMDMVSAFRALRDVPPGQLNSVLNEPNFRNQYNDNERQILKGMSELNIGPAAQR